MLKDKVLRKMATDIFDDRGFEDPYMGFGEDLELLEEEEYLYDPEEIMEAEIGEMSQVELNEMDEEIEDIAEDAWEEEELEDQQEDGVDPTEKESS